MTTEELKLSALDNLLIGCGKIGPGSKVLLVNEPDKASVEPALIAQIEARAQALGAEVRSIWTPAVAGPEHIPAEVLDAIAAADVSILNHGLGGMLRLRPVPGNGIGILNYASSEAVLSSDWARVPYALWEQVAKVVGADLSKAGRWHITCPNGTDLRGEVPEAERAKPALGTGFSLQTFPIGTHRPTSTTAASGKIALRWLVSSANHDVGPGLKLERPVLAHVEQGRIVDIEGEAAEVAKARAYLEKIGQENGQDPYIINSWHAGTNPRAFTPWRSEADLNVWQLLTHNNPRSLHFHVVGHKVPGELSLPVLDATVTLDGVVYWERGRFTPLEQPAVQALLSQFPQAQQAFELNANLGLEEAA